MLNTVYQLKGPRQFEITFKDVELDREHVIVRPTYLSICNADQRYYQGTRAEEILKGSEKWFMTQREPMRWGQR